MNDSTTPDPLTFSDIFTPILSNTHLENLAKAVEYAEAEGKGRIAGCIGSLCIIRPLQQASLDLSGGEPLLTIGANIQVRISGVAVDHILAQLASLDESAKALYIDLMEYRVYQDAAFKDIQNFLKSEQKPKEDDHV